MSAGKGAPPQDHAVVLGASLSGLLAARVLTERFSTVTVVERDELLHDAGPRRGVPQGRHVHGLLGGGTLILEELLRGFIADAVARGAVLGDVLGDVRWQLSGHRLSRTVAGVPGLAASRPFLEQLVRDRVTALPGVQVLDGTAVSGIQLQNGCTTGVHLFSHGGGARTVDADLVVDATGRGSHLPQWLIAAEFPAPVAERVEVGVRYASQIYRLRPNALGGDHGIVLAATPDNPRGGIMASIEGGRHILTLAGLSGTEPPLDPAGFAEFACQLAAPDVRDAIRGAETVGDPVAIRFPAGVRRRYERLTRFPSGLCVLGDGVCSLNPVYGQGMTSAARQAMAMRRTLTRPDWSFRTYFRRIAAAIDPPWSMAVANDLAFPGVSATRSAPIRIAETLLPAAATAAAADQVVSRAFVRVMSLVDRPTSLLHPRVLLPILQAQLGAGR